MELPFMEFRRASNLFLKYSKFPDRDLYMLTIPMVQHDRYNLTTQASKSFFLQNLCTFTFEN